MKEALALTVFVAVLLLLVAIYITSKLFPRVSKISYKLVGCVCLLASVGFFAFVGWYFINTGQLVSPGKYVPSKTILPSDSVAIRVFVGAFNVVIGSLLACVGMSMLRIK